MKGGGKKKKKQILVVGFGSPCYGGLRIVHPQEEEDCFSCLFFNRHCAFRFLFWWDFWGLTSWKEKPSTGSHDKVSK